MRKATKTWAARGVIIVLALSFGAWGINDVFTGGSRAAVATVGDVDVPTVLFDRQFQRALQQERERSGRPDLTREEAHRAGLTGRVLNMLVREYLLDAEANTLGLRAADVSVMRELESAPAFANEQGAFDPELYDLVLERNNMTRGEYEDLIRVDLLREQLIGTIGSDRPVPEALAGALPSTEARTRTRTAWYSRASNVPTTRPCHDDLCAPIGLRLQENRVEVVPRFQPRGSGLQRLRTSDLAAVDADRGVVGHVLRLERRDADAAAPGEPAQSRNDEGLADAGAGALDHQGAAGHSRCSMSVDGRTSREALPVAAGTVIRRGGARGAALVSFGLRASERTKGRCPR